MDNVFPILKVDMDRFPIGQEVDDVDRHNKPIKGLVLDVKPGNNVALVIIEPRRTDSGNESGVD